jgi:enoyl-CoA hydratase/carnithine racemase
VSAPDTRSFETLLVSAEGARGEIVLNRPERLNALSGLVLDELAAAATWMDAHEAVKVVVVRGAGRSFSAGADLEGFGGAGDEAALREAALRGRRMGDAVAGMRAVTIASVRGHCLGGAMVLAAACDLRVASEDAEFALPEVDLGIPLTWGGVPRLVAELGPAFTKELVLTCRTVRAYELRELRFLNAVVPEAELDDRVDALADRLTAQPGYVLRVTKWHVNAVAEADERVDEARFLVEALRDPESLQKMRSYLADRGR